MKPDLIIRNGTVIDGTGTPRRNADIAVNQGKITAIGAISGDAKRVIDARGRIVAPGFIDPHTHYDAQLWWDADLSPSPWHGVTTVVMGNCGVGIAPCRPAAREAAMHDLVNVEGIPFEVMEQGIQWDWESFPEFMAAAERRHPAVNVAFLAPLTPFRYHVMGDAAAERGATPEETAQIRDLLDGAMAAGAFGFTTTLIPNHVGYKGRPLACKQASTDELRAYSNVLRDRKAGAIELALCQRASILTDEDCALLDLLLTESGRQVTWLALVHREDIPDACDRSLEKGAELIRRGAVPQIMSMPMTREIELRFNPHSFQGYKCWHQVANKSAEERIAIYGSREFRDQFREELKRPTSFTGNWSLIAVRDAANPSLKALEGRTIAEIARDRGCDGVDALLDIAIEDDLNTSFAVAFLNTDQKSVGKLIANPDTLIGLSDGGAHLGVLCDSGYCTYVLGNWVRTEKILSLEQAVVRLAAQPADFFGITDRGRLKPGLAADIVVFDPDEVASANQPEKLYDLPGGGKRFVMRSRGIDFTIVNGVVVYEAGAMTGDRSGQVLRS